MKCSKHYERDAVSQCVDCGKALCPECTEKFNVPLCDQCALNRINADKQLLVKNSVIMIVLFVVGFLWSGQEGFFQRILMGYFFAGIPWGWSILTKITPSMFLFMSWIGWLIYFLVKLMLSMLIGMFVTPYKIYKIIKGLSDAKALENYTKGASA
jgi:B-box zinc finger.